MTFTDDSVSLLQNEQIEFPARYTHYENSAKHILIAPEYPTWIVLDQDEYSMFLCLEQANLSKALKLYKNRFNKDGGAVQEKVLEKIFNNNFYKDGLKKTINEENIETIQKNIHINLTNDCNMRCKHCFINAGRVEKAYADINKIIRKVDEITKINGYTSVVVSGGEPLLHKDIFALLEALKGHQITLFTNGILINNKNIDKISTSVSEIQISMEGISQDEYEKNRGKNNYKKLLNTINLIKSKNIKLILAITILPQTLMDVRQNLLNFLKTIDYKNLQIRLNNEIEMIGAAVNELDFKDYDIKYSNKIIYQLIKKLSDIGISSKSTKQQNIKFKNCGIGTSIVIDVNGRIYPCSKFASYSLSIDKNASEIFSEFDRINRETSIDNIKKCKSCDLKFICSGGCRIDNFTVRQSMLNVTCDKKYKQNIVQRLINEWDYEKANI